MPYAEFFAMVVASATIPGLRFGWVPQGAAWDARNGAAIVSYYADDSAHVTSQALGEGPASSRPVRRRAALRDIDGSPLRSHAGGAAATGPFLWTSSGGRITRFSLDGLLRTNSRTLDADTQFQVITKASFLSAEADGLWVGDFRKRREGLRAQAAFYPLDVEGRPRSTPTKTWLLPDRVQGMAVCSGLVALSLSGGPKDSALELHRPPAADGLLSEQTLLRRVAMPAGSEDLECADGRLLVLFESGATRYREKWKAAGATVDEGLYLLSLKPPR